MEVRMQRAELLVLPSHFRRLVALTALRIAAGAADGASLYPLQQAAALWTLRCKAHLCLDYDFVGDVATVGLNIAT